MKYTCGEIANILGVPLRGHSDRLVSLISIDSRSISQNTSQTVFVAIPGNIVDGHKYVQNCYDKNVRVFIVSQEVQLPIDASIIQVDNTLKALQFLASYHRNQFEIPVVSVTGSNGKTIIKEWLSALLSQHLSVIKSPKSYNSQIGVPLSVLEINNTHEVAVFEAGISQVGEMVHLQNILKPTIGIFSNIGDAHSSGFESKKEKFNEKAILFSECNSLIYNKNDNELSSLLEEKFSTAKLHPYSYEFLKNGRVNFSFYGKSMEIELPFYDEASVENLLASISTLCLLGIDIKEIEKDLKSLDRIQMRLETKDGKWGSTLINDAYSSDLQSLENAVQYLQQSQAENPIIILSDLEENQSPELLYPKVAKILNAIEHTLITVGENSNVLARLLDKKPNHYQNIDSITLNKSLIENRTILLKGARKYRFEILQKQLAAQSHSASLEIDLSAMEHNLSVYASMIPDTTKIMTVIKASAYGSGAMELAKHLQHRQVAYMAVAYIDEGIELRKSGISTPILVLNPDLDQLDEMLSHHLEPEVYNLEQLRQIILYSQQEERKIFPPIHIKLDTGMHRLGFRQDELENLIGLLRKSNLKVASIFSHLAASDDAIHEEYSLHQIRHFDELCTVLIEALGYRPLLHIANTAAISRYPSAHYDMVRLGLGLYGIDNKPQTSTRLERVHTLIAKVIQIKSIPTGETVGYNRTHRLTRDSKIAVINIGYADGLMRSSGNGKHDVMIHNQMVPIIGNVCMDLTLLDVTDIETIKIGDPVEIFGKSVDITQLAKVNSTIPYELLAGISTRVKKVYVRS